MNVIVKLNGNPINYDCEPTDLVSDFKAKVEAAAEVAADKQLLYYDGVLMEDEQTLQDYSINADDIIICIEKPEPEQIEPEPTEPAEPTEKSENITLKALVKAYKGDVLFSVKEGEEDSQTTVISFKNNEYEALKEDLLNREVKDYTIETKVEIGISKKNVAVFINVTLGEAETSEEPSGEPGGEPSTNDPSTNNGGGTSDP